MPEGDTVHTIANYLAPRLEGRILDRLGGPRIEGAADCAGRRIEEVFAQGKHLYIELDNGLALRSHLGMYGSWHRYADGEQWRKPPAQASIVLETDDAVYVCFNAKEIELVRSSSIRRRILRARLGPDLVADEPDIGLAARRARELLPPATPIADVLLDQRAASGIGNVYKSEILFIEGMAPSTPLAAVTDERLRTLYARGAALMRQNTAGGRRVTRFENDGAGRLWVYGRAGKPCLRCGTIVASDRLGRHGRSTYWCPRCQAGP